MATEQFNEDTLSKIKKRRGLVRANVTKTITSLEETGLDEVVRLAKIASLNEMARTLEELDNKILDRMLDEATDEALEIENTRALEIRENIMRIKIIDENRRKTISNFENRSTNSENLISCKLPKLSLERYDLSPSNWLAWWTQFKSIHEAEDMEDHVKFKYMRMTLEGPAKVLIDSYPNTATNYSKALDHLRNRFGKEERIVRCLYKELFDLIRERPSLIDLYDKISSKVRGLETIGVTGEKIAVVIPLIEECMPIEVRRLWERRELQQTDKTREIYVLLEFLNKEAESEERIQQDLYYGRNKSPRPSTTAVLVNTENKFKADSKPNQVEQGKKTIGGESKTTRSDFKPQCIFCSATHRNKDCSAVMSSERRWEIAKASNVCFACLNKGHSIRRCRTRVNCSQCKGRHYSFMCNRERRDKESTTANLLASQKVNETIVLKTLLVYACCNDKRMIVRVLLDSASHRSYVSARVCKLLNLANCGEEGLQHMLFGGQISEKVSHTRHELELLSLTGHKRFALKALRQETICGKVPVLGNNTLLQKVAKKGIQLTDDGYDRPIDVLIGADYMGGLLTGTIKSIDTRLIAFETVLGWCLLGAAEAENVSPTLMNVACSLVCLPNLWDLETLGIETSKASSSKTRAVEDCCEHFEENVRFDDGYYEVALPWLEGHPPLPTNYELAKKRLCATINRLNRNGMYDEYDEVFRQWERAEFIEIVEEDVRETGHYLPHRPVIREGKTTKIRPVFDASAKREGSVSLNECLSTGPNLIPEILPLLLKFRHKRVGVVADIKQTFLMIKLRFEKDKNMLKFLWMRGQKLITLRHRRVVFGLSPSPFLLNATIRRHLKQIEDPIASKLLRSFYVDNCLLSLESREQVQEFRAGASELMRRAKFELRGWIESGDEIGEHSVLGVRWSPNKDLIGCYQPKIETVGTLTKRNLLSIVGRMYDPIGLLAAPILYLKLGLQECFRQKLTWNEPLPKDLKEHINKWLVEIYLIDSIKVNRCLEDNPKSNTQLHVFADASKLGMGICAFLRTQCETDVRITFVAGKSRVSPLETLTIPRLELIAAGMAARLGDNISRTLEVSDITYWSDSMIVLYWIKRDEWKAFVGNRVKEIRKLSLPETWRFVDGTRNPADLLSRGCLLSEYVSREWTKGPEWLSRPTEEWPYREIVATEDTLAERKVVNLANVTDGFEIDKNMFSYFNSFKRNVRLMAWLRRFWLKARKYYHQTGELTVEEIICAEDRLLAWLQRAWKPEVKDLETYTDHEGLLRVRTKILSSQFSPSFRSPLVLAACPLVASLIEEKHKELYHAGVSWVLNSLRESIWIIRGRQFARKVLKGCNRCKKIRGKPIVTAPIALPDNRVNLGKIFQVSGCDLMGPLYTKNNNKVWIVIFTCAVYRAVHLEIVKSLSTEDFLLALRRMIARRGRISVLYSDNGTNFVGAWNHIDKACVGPMKIKWIFNAPTASWWGGFFERLIGIIKTLMRTSLSNALLSGTELYTVVTELEAVLNKRPLTYVSEDTRDPLPITPASFLQQEEAEVDTPDLDSVDESGLCRRARYILSIRKRLKERFAAEYLGALLLRSSKIRNFPQRILEVGSLAWIASENEKRQKWELGRVLETFPGKDGVARVARLKTQKGELVRPVQRLIPLEGFDDYRESTDKDAVENDITKHVGAEVEPSPTGQGRKGEVITPQETPLRTASGRAVKKPARFID